MLLDLALRKRSSGLTAVAVAAAMTLAQVVPLSAVRAQENKGPAVLRIAYIANAANPDIYRIKPGAF